jgi:hypothetical protein
MKVRVASFTASVAWLLLSPILFFPGRQPTKTNEIRDEEDRESEIGRMSAKPRTGKLGMTSAITS